jgi:hypothetical protein
MRKCFRGRHGRRWQTTQEDLVQRTVLQVRPKHSVEWKEGGEQGANPHDTRGDSPEHFRFGTNGEREQRRGQDEEQQGCHRIGTMPQSEPQLAR